ncbi:DUF4276 family protein [Desulfotalea psychrophila]|uniref:DUF4276 family protein n=1 Tax=Desulfotalea psychrophila (strain LSv54 / DSM 12343) TaxID=177439 RepID=Q6AIC1_DESPS|nr:DUF4276 family protein [Desulfotalea psychrophila]CAG37926.1 conserved hypothetical protein [Desulfotalea psychrophila LSv54]
MSDFIEVMVIVEGKTEENFVKSLLSKYLSERNIFMSATQVTKLGQKGGDVRFERVKNDIGLHLKQRADTYVTTLVDYYGIKEWPGLDEVPPRSTPTKIAQIVNRATSDKVRALFSSLNTDRRFVPYIAIHEFEALLFSDSRILASELGISEEEVTSVLVKCSEPEAINNSPETAPSKRLDGWAKNGKFAKTSAGIAIAKIIGIAAMRDRCPVFNDWLERLEMIQRDLP